MISNELYKNKLAYTNNPFSISIIVPIYNVGKFLEKCLSSICNQTYTKLEIILVNDGSTDNSKSICETFLKSDKRIKIINKKNGGLSSARNTGLINATGDIVIFIDSDDYVEPNLCQIIVEKFNNYNSDAIVFGYATVKENGDLINKFTYLNFSEKNYNNDQIIKSLFSHSIENYAWNKAFKRKCIQNVFFPEGHDMEDIATIYKFFLQCNSILIINDCLYYYVQRFGSITSKRNKKLLIDTFIANKDRYENLKKDIRFSNDMHILENDIINSAIKCCSYHCDSSLVKDIRLYCKKLTIYKNNKTSRLQKSFCNDGFVFFVFSKIFCARRDFQNTLNWFKKILKK